MEKRVGSPWVLTDFFGETRRKSVRSAGLLWENSKEVRTICRTSLEKPRGSPSGPQDFFGETRRKSVRLAGLLMEIIKKVRTVCGTRLRKPLRAAYSHIMLVQNLQPGPRKSSNYKSIGKRKLKKNKISTRLLTVLTASAITCGIRGKNTASPRKIPDST